MISGLVFQVLKANGARNVGDSGIAGVTLQLLSDNGSQVATVAAAADGRYVFEDVPTGS